MAADTLVARYNDLGSVERILRRHRDRVAALIVEPVAGNMGVVLPEAGFLEGLRALCDEHGAILVFDATRRRCCMLSSYRESEIGTAFGRSWAPLTSHNAHRDSSQSSRFFESR